MYVGSRVGGGGVAAKGPLQGLGGGWVVLGLRGVIGRRTQYPQIYVLQRNASKITQRETLYSKCRKLEITRENNKISYVICTCMYIMYKYVYYIHREYALRTFDPKK